VILDGGNGVSVAEPPLHHPDPATGVSRRDFDMQTALFQPVGGMGRIGEAFARELGPVIEYHAKVTEIRQDASGVTVT
jgi:monoamine oxidase